MTTAAELIHAMQLRLRVTAWRNRPGEFPPGWQEWFEQMRERVGAVSGASAEAVVAVFLQRPLSAPPRGALALNRWQAFSTLWRQQWQPPARDERWLRALATVVSGLVHLVFAVILVWLTVIQFVLSAPPRGEETVVQVEYIGAGTPEEVGGGPIPDVRESEPAPQPPTPQPPEAEPQTTTASPRPPELPTIPVQAPELDAPQPQVAQRDIPVPQPPAQQPTEQAVAVSKPVPDRATFVLPPPTVEVPDVEAAEPALQAPLPPLRVAETPEPLPSFEPAMPQVEVERPAVRSEIPEVVVREIPAPLPPVELPQPSPPVVRVPELRAPAPEVAVRSIPTPAEQAEQPAVAEAASETAETAPPEPIADTAAPPTDIPAPEIGTGPDPIPAPGGWPSPQVADDWDLADSEQPGGQAGQPPGLYDSDGSVNLAQTPGSASPGLPPGTITEEIADLDRAGTWLRRAPTDYEPTAFARYWRPNESLLAEWVRKSVTTVRIPIPGTSKSIVCKTVLLALGGACGIDDPNLNDQPATARPPPDIPFDPDLQEGNGSAPPGG